MPFQLVEARILSARNVPHSDVFVDMLSAYGVGSIKLTAFMLAFRKSAATLLRLPLFIGVD